MNDLTPQTGASAVEVARTAPLNQDFGHSPLMNPMRFEHMYRIGRMLASSMLWPKHLKGNSIEEGAANGMLCLNMAERLKEDPLTVAQNIYFVSGKPGWNTTYMIAKANMHGVFSDPIDWDVKGRGETLSVTAFGIMKGSGKRVEVTCDMAMAKAEGWTSNKKYQSMPEQMLRYRSAAFLIRLYAPEVMIGVPSQVELELDRDYRDVTPEEPVSDASASIGMVGDTKAIPATKVDRTPPAPAVTEQTIADEKAAAEAAAEAEAKAKAKAEAAEKKASDAKAKAEAKEKAEADKAEAAEKAALEKAQQDRIDEAKKQFDEQRQADLAADSETPHNAETGEVLATGEDYERMAGVSRAVLKDLEGSDDPDAVLGFYSEQIEKMKAVAPDLYEEIIEAAKP